MVESSPGEVVIVRCHGELERHFSAINDFGYEQDWYAASYEQCWQSCIYVKKISRRQCVSRMPAFEIPLFARNDSFGAGFLKTRLLPTLKKTPVIPTEQRDEESQTSVARETDEIPSTLGMTD